MEELYAKLINVLWNERSCLKYILLYFSYAMWMFYKLLSRYFNDANVIFI